MKQNETCTGKQLDIFGWASEVSGVLLLSDNEKLTLESVCVIVMATKRFDGFNKTEHTDGFWAQNFGRVSLWVKLFKNRNI